MQTERQYRGSLQQVVVRPNVVGAALVEWSGGLVGLFPSERFLKILLALPAYAWQFPRMTTTQTKDAGLGRNYWTQYIKLNGWAMEPNENGLKRLSRNLDLNIPHLRRCINLYLEA